jgi:hypothetical protein
MMRKLRWWLGFMFGTELEWGRHVGCAPNLYRGVGGVRINYNLN